MAFGNNLDQNNFPYTWTQPNSFCGGFVVYAILNDRNLISGITPMDIYRKIQRVQQIDSNTSPASAKMLLDTLSLGNGTSMSLPSSMCKVMAEYRLPLFVGYTNKFIISTFNGLLGEELTKITTLGNKFPVSYNKFDLLNVLTAAIKSYPYHIVLSNNGKHWVVIKNVAPTQYELYNPGGGTSVTYNSLDDALKNITEMMELVISILA